MHDLFGRKARLEVNALFCGFSIYVIRCWFGRAKVVYLSTRFIYSILELLKKNNTWLAPRVSVCQMRNHPILTWAKVNQVHSLCPDYGVSWGEDRSGLIIHGFVCSRRLCRAIECSKAYKVCELFSSLVLCKASGGTTSCQAELCQGLFYYGPEGGIKASRK